MYKGRRKCSGQVVALKFIMKHGKSEKDVRNLRQEIEILRKLKHENIIQMLDAFETAKEFCVVTEFAQGVHQFHDADDTVHNTTTSPTTTTLKKIENSTHTYPRCR